MVGASSRGRGFPARRPAPATTRPCDARRPRSTCRRRPARAADALRRCRRRRASGRSIARLRRRGSAPARARGRSTCGRIQSQTCVVVFGQHLLGDAGIVPIDAVGMAQRHAGDLDRRPDLPAGFGRLRGLGRRLLPQRGLLRSAVSGICSTSRTTCFAGLSSRTPLNEPCRTSLPPVQPRKSTSTTSFGSTHFTSRRRSSSRDLVERRVLSRATAASLLRRVALLSWPQPVPTRPA